MEPDKSHIFSLAPESLEIVLDHLELDDLRLVSETCRYFESLSWTNRSLTSKITLNRMLSGVYVNVLKTTKKEFNNFVFNPKHITNGYSYNLIAQVSKLPSIKPLHVELREDQLSNAQQLFEEFKNMIQTITVTLRKSSRARMILKVQTLQSEFPNARINIRIKSLSSRINFSEFNAEMLYPHQMGFVGGGYNIQESVYNVRKLNWSNPDQGILNFKNLKDLNVISSDQNLLELLLEANQSTLTKLTLIHGTAINRVPSQLKELRLSSRNISDQYWIPNLLAQQNHLRKLILVGVTLTPEILSTLDNKTVLTTLKMSACQLTHNLIVLPSVRKVKIASCDTRLLDAFLRKSDLTSLEIHKISGDLTHLRSRYVLRKLKCLVVEDMFEYKRTNTRSVTNELIKAIIATNLEVCTIADYNSTFFGQSSRLRELDIRKYGRMVLSAKELQYILKYSMVTIFQFNVRECEFMKILPDILKYSGSIKHFVITIGTPRCYEQISNELKKMPNYSESDSNHFYHSCGNFTMEISLGLNFHFWVPIAYGHH